MNHTCVLTDCPKLYWTICDTSKPAYPPKKATPGSAGYDLCAAETKVLMPNKVTAVDTNIAVVIPDKAVGKVACRSGLYFHHNIENFGAIVTTQNIRYINNFVGIIDSDFRGPLQIAMLNTLSEPITIETGKPIAQLLIEPLLEVTPEHFTTVVDNANVDNEQKLPKNINYKADFEAFLNKFATERGTNGFGSTG